MKKETFDRYIDKIVERVRTERMPIFIGEVIIFGSYLGEKINPADLDILLTDRHEITIIGESYDLARRTFFDIIELESIAIAPHLIRYHPQTITERLIRLGMKGLDISIGSSIDDFIHCFKDKDGTLIIRGLPMHIVWSSSWENDLPRDKQHPMLPFIRFLRMVDTKEIRELNLDFDRIEEIAKSRYDQKKNTIESQRQSILKRFEECHIKNTGQHIILDDFAGEELH